MITHELLHLARWNFARTHSLTITRNSENFKVIGQSHKSGFSDFSSLRDRAKNFVFTITLKPYWISGHTQMSHGFFCAFFVCMILWLPMDSSYPWVRLDDLVVVIFALAVIALHFPVNWHILTHTSGPPIAVVTYLRRVYTSSWSWNFSGPESMLSHRPFNRCSSKSQCESKILPCNKYSWSGATELLNESMMLISEMT